MHCEQNFFDSINTVHLTGNPTKTSFMVLVVYIFMVAMLFSIKQPSVACDDVMPPLVTTLGAGDTRGCYAANGAENIENIDSAR